MYKRLLMILAGFPLLAGGGGGGSTAGGVAYTGVTTQATVTTANAKALSVDAYSGNQLSSAVSGIAKETAGNGGQAALLREAAAILRQSVTAIVTLPASSAKVAAATAQNTVNGYSGSYSYTISVDQTSGAFSGTMALSRYRENSTATTLSGSITFSGVYNQSSASFTSLNITMSNLAGTSGATSYRLDGSESYTTNGATSTVTMTVILTDNVSGRTFWVKGFTLTLTGSSLTVTGTYYDPIYGHVVISTITPLTVSAIDATPTAGQLLFTGANGTKARLTFTGTGHTVEADTVGNGAYVVVP